MSLYICRVLCPLWPVVHVATLMCHPYIPSTTVLGDIHMYIRSTLHTHMHTQEVSLHVYTVYHYHPWTHTNHTHTHAGEEPCVHGTEEGEDEKEGSELPA